MREIKFEEYSKTLPKAEEIYNQLFGISQSHAEWAERFNKIGSINQLLQNNK